MSSPAQVYVGRCPRDGDGGAASLFAAVAVVSPVTAGLASVTIGVEQDLGVRRTRNDRSIGRGLVTHGNELIQLMLSSLPQWSVAVAVNVRVKL